MSASVGKVTKTGKVTVTFTVKKEAVQGAEKNGTFKGSISIPADGQVKYQYKFKYTFADESVKFDNDWDAEGYTANPFGGENSFFSIVKE